MDRIQSFILHDKVAEQLEELQEEFGYNPAQVFNLGVQILGCMLRMKEDGWEVGTWKLVNDGKSIRQKKMRFPHEEEFAEADEIDPDVDFLNDYGDNDDDNEGWLNLKWKED